MDRCGGPFRAIETSVPGIHVSELLPHTAQQMHHLTLVRNLHTAFEINPVPGSCCLDIHPDGLRLAIAQFQENGRGKNGGNGRNATPEEYRCHHGVVRIYDMTAKEA